MELWNQSQKANFPTSSFPSKINVTISPALITSAEADLCWFSQGNSGLDGTSLGLWFLGFAYMENNHIAPHPQDIFP